MLRYLKRLYGPAGLILLAVVGLALPAAAAGSDISGAVTQSYSADAAVQTGMIVGLKPKDSSTVIPLTSKDVRNMLGVVVPVNDAAIVLTPQSAPAQQVLVANSGRHGLLVSNQNGFIKSGDYLTISALGGIGMKASAGQAEIIGRAAKDFNGSSDVIGKVGLKGSLGRDTTVSIGRIPIDVHLAANPLAQNGGNLGFLSRTASGVASKPVSSIRVYLSAAVLLATLFVTGNMFYSGVRSSIVAVGRNPLAKKAIGRGLAQTVIAGLIIFAAGVSAVYLILNL